MQANSAPEIPEAKPGKVASSPSLGKTFGLVAVLTFFSKFLGLARDIVVLHGFGAGLVTDAYNYAALFTGNFFVLFGGLGGPFHQSTVAILQPRREDQNVGKLIFQILAITAIILGIITALLYLLAPHLVAAMDWLAGTANQALAMLGMHPTFKQGQNAKLILQVQTQLLIMLPLILIAGIIGILYGISNVYGEFKWPSLSPAIASIAMIVAVLFFKDTLGLCLAYGTLIGAVLQLLAQLPATLPHMRFQLSMKPEPGVGEYTGMLWPATISTSIGQLTVYVDSLFTWSLTSGAWTAIVNSNRLVQLPLGVLLTAMLVPILPRFSDQVAEQRIDDLKAEFRRGVRILWFLSLPIMALLIAIPKPILALLFQHGSFTEEDTRLFSVALIWLAPSILFYVGRDLITRVFYAYKDSTTPYRVAMCAIVLKAVLDWVLIKPLGVGGISLSTTLVTIFNLTVLGWLLRAKIGNLGTVQLIRPLAIMLAGSSLGAAAAYFIQQAISNAMTTEQLSSLAASIHLPSAIVSLAHLGVSIGIASAAAFAIYVGICLACKLEEPHEVLKRLKRRKQPA